MINFVLNNIDIATDLPAGSTVLDFVRYRQNLKGTKIGCREGDCGACTILVGELKDDQVSYRTMTSCLMPLANAAGKHIVTVEGINPDGDGLTPVQQAMVDESGTQCGFCTVGFVMSLTGFCIDDTEKTPEMAVSAVDGNICRCTGYKSIERAACRVSSLLSEPGAVATGSTGAQASPLASNASRSDGAKLFASAIVTKIVPEYFSSIEQRLGEMHGSVNGLPPKGGTPNIFVSGGTDVYVQKPDTMAEVEAAHLFYDDALRGIRDVGEFIEIGASATVTDLLVSPVMQSIFPDLHKHLKLVSSTPIRNMATLAGNFVNASPIGDMTVWFLALDAEITLNTGVRTESGSDRGVLSVPPAVAGGLTRIIKLRDFYHGYKRLDKFENEFITTIHFRKPGSDFYFNFEKVCKRTYLDIATVNTAISLHVESTPGPGWVPPVLFEPPVVTGGFGREASVASGTLALQSVDHVITEAHVAAGGVAPIPLYLKETSAFLIGKEVNAETIAQANEIMQSEISPISDVRGTEQYKRLLLRQLFTAHFVELFDL